MGSRSRQRKTRPCLLGVLCCISFGVSAAFSTSGASLGRTLVRPSLTTGLRASFQPLDQDKEGSDNNNNNKESQSRRDDSRRPRIALMKEIRRAVVQKVVKTSLPVTLGVLSAASLGSNHLMPWRPKAAHAASAPVMAPPKRDMVDPETEAMFDVTKRIEKKNAKEMLDYQTKAREIAKTQGEAARTRFEQEWEQARRERAEEKAKGLQQLKRDLLDEGICPFCDLEGKRQLMKFEKDVDLAEVPGTKYYMEKDFQENQYKRSMKYQKQAHRFIIKSMVQDMKKKGIDPLDYFQKNKAKTEDILNMSTQKAILVAEQYKANLAEYGQLTKPKPGEEIKRVDPEEQAKLDKEAAEKAKQDEKAKLKAEKAAQAAALKAEKQKQKEQAKRLKEEAKQEKAAAKAAAAAAAATASAAAAATAAATSAAGQAVQSSANTLLHSEETPTAVVSEGSSGDTTEGETSPSAGEPETEVVSKKAATKKGGLPIVPVVSFVVAAGGGGFAVKFLKEKAERDEEERQRQFRLLMGEDTPKKKKNEIEEDVISSLDLGDDVVLGEEHSATEDSATSSSSEAPEEIVAPKKKKGGIRSMFGKKNANSRETELSVMVSPDATAPEFALLLAKILTFGAPGRFPLVTSLPGEMPMEEFDLDAAKEKLTDASAEIANVEAAEIFANVVNCMLIDMVDLASAALKEDDKVTVDAINVVVDFMNHAASLYDAIAGDVIITPVTYGGTLAKSKLEQMYSTYAASGIMSMDEDFNARVGLLQDVFGISEKKAEGLMMKAMQKNMMNMMKDPEGMAGMEEMMQAMGGAEGLEGLGALGGLAEGEEPSPEQLKEMLTALKTMKDSGTIPPDELDAVRSQFREAFGSSIEDVMKDADADKDALGDTDKELLDLMKSILDD